MRYSTFFHSRPPASLSAAIYLVSFTLQNRYQTNFVKEISIHSFYIMGLGYLPSMLTVSLQFSMFLAVQTNKHTNHAQDEGILGGAEDN